MDIIVSYDVNTLTKDGRRRLRKVAKTCEGYGQRVQLSVFECTVNDVERELLKTRLLKIILPDEDSLRIYTLHGGRQNALESFGRDRYIDFTDLLVA